MTYKFGGVANWGPVEFVGGVFPRSGGLVVSHGGGATGPHSA